MNTVYELVIGGQTKRSAKGQHPVSVDFAKLPENAQAFVIAYGLKQFLADGMAGAEDEAEAKASVEARLARLASGDLSRTRGEAKDAPDTVETRARKMIRAAIVAKAKAANLKPTKEAIADAVAKVLADEAKGADWRKQAKAQLDAESKLAESVGSGDLADLI